MLLLTAAEVRQVLPMSGAIAVIRAAMLAHGRGGTHQPLRLHVEPPGVPGLTLIKPAALEEGRGGYGMKVISVFPGNRQHGLPTATGVVVLLDPATGQPLALVDGAVVTEIRTAAASAVATDVLARGDAGDLALLGAGVQARSHLRALAEVRELRRVRVWSRSAGSSTAFAEWARAAGGWAVEAVGSAREAVDGADLVCTVTTSATPVVEGEWLASGCHVNAVGAFQPDARELDSAVVADAAVVVVDSRESALAEAGDLLIPLREGRLPADTVFPELGEVLDGRAPGRGSFADRTVYESLGLAVQDVAVAAEVHRAAQAAGLGTELDLTG